MEKKVIENLKGVLEELIQKLNNKEKYILSTGCSRGGFAGFSLFNRIKRAAGCYKFSSCTECPAGRIMFGRTLLCSKYFRGSLEEKIDNFFVDEHGKTYERAEVLVREFLRQIESESCQHIPKAKVVSYPLRLSVWFIASGVITFFLALLT